MSSYYCEGLPPLLHVGFVVLDLEAAASDFERRWGARVSEIADVVLHKALYHGRPATITFRRGLISSGPGPLELTQPLSESPFCDFLAERKSDGIHHLAFVVDDIDQCLARLEPTRSELVLDAQLPENGGRTVYLNGFAHGPAIELIKPAETFNDQAPSLRP